MVLYSVPPHKKIRANGLRLYGKRYITSKDKENRSVRSFLISLFHDVLYNIFYFKNIAAENIERKPRSLT
jgi:hypothetical protein